MTPERNVVAMARRQKGSPVWLLATVVFLSVALALSVARGSVWASLIIALLLLPSLALAVALVVVTLRDQVPRRRQA
jgi:predicted cobalt transporter CbtA